MLLDLFNSYSIFKLVDFIVFSIFSWLFEILALIFFSLLD